jgi:hypothetical protein
MNSRSHQKIVVEHSAVDHDAFADFYRFGPVPQPAMPLVVYFGGAISTDVYNARRDTEPLSLVELVEDALIATGVESVDLLVVPCPLIGRKYPDFRSRIFRFFLEELLPRTPNPEPERMAFFGNSAGAHIAATFAFELDSVRALATTAAVGLVEAADESERRLFEGRRYLSFANEADPGTEHTYRFWEAMILRGISVDVFEREGGHAFEDYVANGSAREAFAWLLDSVSTKA